MRDEKKIMIKTSTKINSWNNSDTKANLKCNNIVLYTYIYIMAELTQNYKC